MKSYGTEDNSLVSVARGQQAIAAQLQKAISSMHHIDELFLWLSHAIVHTFKMQGIQWWALQAVPPAGQLVVRLRAMIHQDTTIPPHVLNNGRVVAMVERLPATPQGFLQAGIERLCVPYQATLFSRYGIHCAGWLLIRHPSLLLPAEQSVPKQASPLALNLVLYSQQMMSPQLFSSINQIVEQALSIAGTYGLLLSVGLSQKMPAALPFSNPPGGVPQSTPNLAPRSLPSTAPLSPASGPLTPSPLSEQVISSLPTNPPMPAEKLTTASLPTPADPQSIRDSLAHKSPLHIPQPTQLDLLQLTPRQYERILAIEIASVRTSKPVIADKQARRLYEAVDGQSTLEEVRARVNMDLQDLYRAVRFLLRQQRIQLFEPDGQLVESEQFLKEK